LQDLPPATLTLLKPSTAGVKAALAALGALSVAAAIILSYFTHDWYFVGPLGAVGLALLARARLSLPISEFSLLADTGAFALFAYQRNDNLAFWQLGGSWADVFSVNAAGAVIAHLIYVSGALAAGVAALRRTTFVEKLSLVALPFLFSLLVNLSADWHMAEIGAWFVPVAWAGFPALVFVGRAVVLLVLAEAGLQAISWVARGRVALGRRLHVVVLAAAAAAAASPLLANAAQMVSSPLFSIAVAAFFAALSQAALWGVVYIATGLAIDALARRPPTSAAVIAHFRAGLSKGAIYGATFMALIYALAFPLRMPDFVAFVAANPFIVAPVAGAALFPLAQTLISSSDGTPPFFGRLFAAYRSPRNYARGVVVGVGGALAYLSGLAGQSGGDRFLFAFVVGAIAYAGVDFSFDVARVASGERSRVETWRSYALGVLLGGVVAGALGWYFDTQQIGVVAAKFWAYADPNYRLDGRALGDFVTRPIFNKYGAVNLGEVAGGVRLFYAESVSGVINWGIASPLFSINYVLLSALLERSFRPILSLVSAKGVEGLIEQTVRVLRWGLWMAPIINTFLKQSADPTWYNQDGALRTLVSVGADVGMTPADFRDFSLMMFLGLLAYDWLRVVIWFDHMGVRVASLVNASFLVGDRADEAAARFLGHGARTRVIPDGIRRFGTWAPLLIPFYIPRGAEWDRVWTGAETLSRGDAPVPAAITTLAIVYAVAGLGIVAGAGAATLFGRERRGAPAPPLEGAPEALGELPDRYTLTNGSVGVEVWRDGRAAATIAAAERGGFAIDFIRRPLDPHQSRGQFFYVCEDGAPPWSIGFEPARRAGDYRVDRFGRNGVAIENVVDGVRARMEIAPDPHGAVVSWRVSLANESGRVRRLRLTSFAEIAGHEVGAYARDLDFAGMHVETIFIRRLNAIFARNRLLRSSRAGRQETSVFAVRPGDGAKLVGYEDSRTRFLGEGSLRRPTGCEPMRWRQLDDEGKLWTFDPAASFTLDVALDPDGVSRAEFIMARADTARLAADLCAERLSLASLPDLQLQTWFYETRAVEPSPGLPNRWPFSFSDDGRQLRLTHRTPRPWAHVMANPLGASLVVSNDGDVYSAFGNSRHNGLTPFRFDSAAAPQPGQVIYLRDLEAQETDAVGFAPFQRDGGGLDLAYEPGVARLEKRFGAIKVACDIFVPDDFPGDMRLLALSNDSDREARLRVAPFFDMALDESPNESAGRLKDEVADGVVLVENPKNDMVRGVAFVATSLAGATIETKRARFFGAPGRDITSPVFVETGAADSSRPDDWRRVAAFASDVAIPPGGVLRVAIAIGMAPTRSAALAAAKEATVERAEAHLAETRAAWAKRLRAVRVKTNREDFDRLVNTWLPYQAYASRLFGRVGPNQRGGAVGYRDQLQDVLPLVVGDPARTRAQIVLHAGQQFLEGDVLKWWHKAPNGATGLGQRTKASDPHLWLPYVLARYVRESGDASVLDVETPFLAAEAVPESEDTWLVAPRLLPESAKVYDHAKLAIRYTLSHLGENGLPLIGAGDWNDGIDAIGRKGKGTSVWMGFFAFNVIDGFLAVARSRGDEAFAKTCEEALASLGRALEAGWRGDHYALDFTDDGRTLAMPNAMTTGWAAYSGAVSFERALQALEGGLKSIERPDRVLLTETPFFEHSEPYPGRIADYPPGVRENGGQYSHGATWIVDGFLKLAREARGRGDAEVAAKLGARAFEIFEKISPLKKTDPDRIATYGLIPIQQPADIYDGYGHGGRGGWSWYTGSAARMLSAAYDLIGLSMENGAPKIAPDAFEPKGELQLESLTVNGQEFER